MTSTREIYCCGCGDKVEARLTDGEEIYPHRDNLKYLPFWKCDTCGNYVGCHWKTNNPTYPLGVIPTPELRKARKHIHALLDPLWKSGKAKRAIIYSKLTAALGWKYHTANIRSIEEARKVYKLIKEIHDENFRPNSR